MKSVTSSILADYNPKNDDYILTFVHKNRQLSKSFSKFLDSMFNNIILPVYAVNSATHYYFYRDYLEIYDTQYSFSQVLKSYKLPDGSKKLFTFPDAEVNWPYITS